MRPFMPMVRLLLVLGALTATYLLGCQWRSAVGPARVTAEEAKASVAQFLTDPDLPPGIVIRSEGELSQPIELSGGRRTDASFRFDLGWVSAPTEASAGGAFVDPASGVVTGLIVNGPATTRLRAGRAVSRSEALNMARRFCQRHCPAVWQKSDKIREHVSLIPMGPDVWNCMFDGEKRGFTNYISCNVRVLRGTGRVVSYRGALRESMEPPEIVVPRADAETAARKYVGTRLGVASSSLKVMPSPMDKWIVWSYTHSGWHAAHYIALRLAADGGKKMAYPMTVSVDIVTGEIIREEPSPLD